MRKPTPLTIIAALAFLSVAYAQGNHPYLIDTFAGQYPLGDGGPATEALLEFPQGAAVGSDGSVYISDSGRYLIRKVDPGGTISTVADTIFARGLAMEAHGNIYAASYRVVYRITPAGDATVVAGNFRLEHSGDGGPATEAGMRETNDVAVAPDGTLYIADRRSARVRRVTPDGIISTYAGTGTGGFSGDGGPATAAELNGPVGLALDAAGNLYIADAPNDRVRRVALDGTITTFAGNGVRGTPVDGVLAVDSPLRGPAGLEVDAAGNVYIADGFSAVVCRVTPAGGLNIIAGDGTWGFGGDGGPAVAAQLSDARDVSTDSQGNVYITDRENHRIRRVDASGSIETFAGRSHFGGDGGPATQAVLFSPAGVAADSQGNVYIGDTQNHRVRKVAPDGTISTIAGTGTEGTAGDDGPASAAQLRSPTTLAVDAQDQLYIGGWRTVRRIRSDGIIELFAGTGQTGDSGDSGPAREARFQRIQGLVSGPGGSLYIADGESNRVRLVAPDGFIYPFAGTGESGFSGDGGPATAAQLALPTAVASDSQGNVYIVDAGNRRVRKVDPAGTITTIAGTGERAAPDDGQLAAGSPIPNGIGATVDRDGNLLICTYDSIFKITTSGHVYRVAGQGSFGFAGDGGLATEGRLTNARGLAAGPGGEIYIADEGNHRIRRLSLDPPARLEAVNGSTYTGLVGQPLRGPLSVRVIGTAGLPLPGVMVSYVVTSGSAVLDAANAVADAAGVAAVGVTLGDAPGEVVVTASVAGLPAVEFTLNGVADPNGIASFPAVFAGGIAGAGSSVPPVLTVSSRGIVSIYGTAFAPPGTFRQVGPGDLVNGRLPTNLGNICVAFGAQFGYVLHIFENQLNVQVPALPVGQMTGVRVIRNCGLPEEISSNTEQVMVEATAPEFFSWVQNADGVNAIAAVNPITGEKIGPPGLLAGADFVRAAPGDTVDMYATGFGATRLGIAPGEIPSQLSSTLIRPEVFVGGTLVADADVLYSGVTQWAGVYLLRIRVPAVSPGNHAVQVRFGANTSPPGGYLTIGE